MGELLMNIKKWLERAYWAALELEGVRAERNKAYYSVFGTSGGTDIKVQTSKKNSTEAKYLKYLEYDEKLNKSINKLYDIKNQVEDLINAIDTPAYRIILRKRHLEFLNWDVIINNLPWERAQIFRLYDKALKEAEEVYKNMRLNDT